MTIPHIPVLRDEILGFFSKISLGTFVDGTLGAGGHAEALLEAHPKIERFLGFDQDMNALDIAKARLARWSGKIEFIHDNFSNFDAYVTKFDGMLIDLGVSSMQLDTPERGFSFQKDGPLDMRMNPNATLTAATIVNRWREPQLATIFHEFGEERHSRACARVIVQARAKKPIFTTKELVDVLTPVLGSPNRPIHPATRVFQALRIAVNGELDVIEKTLPKAIEALNPGGILAVISFHSLEDRIVKHAFQEAAREKKVTILTKKPLQAEDLEMAKNPRSRSAKLRVVQA